MDDVRFLDSSFWDEAMPGRFRWLQENDPVHWSEPDQCWILTRFDDVAAVSKNQEVFTSAEGVVPAAKIGLIDEPEPHHGQLRGLINKGFTPRMVKKLEGPFLEIVNECIDAVAKKGECDFVEAIAVPLPLLIIAEMIGIRKEDRESFHRWSDHMISAAGSTDPEVIQRAGIAFAEYSAYVTEIIEERRKNPQDDLVSILVGAKDEGMLGEFEQTGNATDGIDDAHKGLANDELVMMLVILLVAGNETTRNALSGGMQLLIEQPDVRQQLIDDPSLIPAAVEELVRLVSPVHCFQRTLTRDAEVAGQAMKQGQKVLLVYPAANRDPAHFSNPDHLDLHRNPNHLAFGLGPHFCLGANLARMELRVAFSELLRRLPDMEFAAGGPVVMPSALVRSCTEMRVRFTPVSD